MSYIIWKRNSSSIRIISSYDLEIHAWLNTLLEQWQGRKSKMAKSHQNTAINEKTLSMERRACQKNQSCCLSFCHLSTPPPPHFRRIRGTSARSSSPEPPYLVENVPPRSLLFTKNMHYRAFSGNLLETNTANKGTPSPPKKKWEHTCYPLVYSRGRTLS